MEKKKKTGFFCCSSSGQRRKSKQEIQNKDDKNPTRKASINHDKISSISSSDNLPEHIINKSDFNKDNSKQTNKIPKRFFDKIQKDISEITNRSNSNLVSKTITPLIPEKNTLPNTELNLSSNPHKKASDAQSNVIENNEIKLNLANKFEEVADTNKGQQIESDNEKIDVSDMKDMCYIPKESKPLFGTASDIKVICDPIMYQSHSSKEKFSLRDGVDFTFKKSIVTENKTDLLFSSNKINKFSPQHEIAEYPNQKDSLKNSEAETDLNKKGYNKGNNLDITNVNSNFYTFSNNNMNSKIVDVVNNNKTEPNKNITKEENKEAIANLKESEIPIAIIKIPDSKNFKNSQENFIPKNKNNSDLNKSNKENLNLSNFKLEESDIYKKLNNLNTFSNNNVNNINLEKNSEDLNIKKSIASNTISDSSPIYSNLMRNNTNTFKIETNNSINLDCKSKDVNETTQKNEEISSNLNNTFILNNMSNTTYNYTNNINNITLKYSNILEKENNSGFQIENKENITIAIDINSFENKSLNNTSDYNSFKDQNKNENDILNVTDENIAPDETEPSVKSETHSIISSKIMSHINTPKMLTDIKTSTEQSFLFSNYTKSDASHRWDNNPMYSSNNHSKYTPDSEDYEYEIMPENLDGYNNFIDTPKSSNLHLPILKTNGSIYRIDPNPKNLSASYNFNHPQLRELNERLSKKEREMRKVNEKIQKVMSELLKYEEENKKYERKIEKEDAEGQMLRHFLNFLTTNS